MNTKREEEIYNSPAGSSGSTTHGPPESARMRGLTARIYAMVRNVAVAPASSVENDDPRSLIWKNFPMKELSTRSFIASMNFILLVVCFVCKFDLMILPFGGDSISDKYICRAK